MKERKVPQNSIAVYGVSVAVSLVLSYIESVIPINLGIPGAKLGLPNMVTVFLLYIADAAGAAGVSAMRIVLSGAMYGNMFSILYSMSGAALSFLCMLIAKKSGKFGVLGVSIMGGITHNFGQLICASFIAGGYVMTYLPVLILAGCVAGTAIGVLSAEIIKRVGRYFK